MAGFTADANLDAALDRIATADRVIACAGQPADYSEATTNLGTGSGKKLGAVNCVTGDFTKADGDTSGRKITLATITGGTVDISDDADHIAFVDDGASELLQVNTCTLQTLTAGNGLSINGGKILEIRDPA